MKVVLFECVGAGTYGYDLSTDLSKEADLMMNAVGQGLVKAGCEVMVFRGAHSAPPSFKARVITTNQLDDWRVILKAELTKTDAFLPIAPESEGVLEELCHFAEEQQCKLLNSSATAVRETTSKSYTLDQLRDNHILCVDYCRVDQCHFPLDRDVVLKPDDEVACDGTFLVRAGQIPTAMQLQKAELCQPYLTGITASINVIYGSQLSPYVLGVNRQEIVVDKTGQFHLRTCHVNELAQLELPFEDVAESVGEVFTDMVGHVGIDLLIDGEKIYILEINPRITTSFAGLAQTTNINPCDLILAAAYGKQFARPKRSSFTSLTIRIN